MRNTTKIITHRPLKGWDILKINEQGKMSQSYVKKNPIKKVRTKNVGIALLRKALKPKQG
jgi:hypothetical protein